MKSVVLFLFLFLSTSLFSQTKVFRGERTNFNDIVYSISNQKVKRMTSSVWGTDILFIRGNKVYDDSFRSNCIYTIVGNKIYKGDSNSVFDLLYEVENNQFFQVSTGSLDKCLFTLNNNQIFVGDSRSTFDCVFSLETDEEVNNSLMLVFLCLAPY